jgi:hypothetical protein
MTRKTVCSSAAWGSAGGVLLGFGRLLSCLQGLGQPGPVRMYPTGGSEYVTRKTQEYVTCWEAKPMGFASGRRCSSSAMKSVGDKMFRHKPEHRAWGINCSDTSLCRLPALSADQHSMWRIGRPQTHFGEVSRIKLDWTPRAASSRPHP